MDPRALLAGLTGMEGSDAVSSATGNSGDIQQLAGALLKAMGGANGAAAGAGPDSSNMQQKPQALLTARGGDASAEQQQKQKPPPPPQYQQNQQPNLQEMMDALKTAQTLPAAASRTSPVPPPATAAPPPAPPQESVADANSQAMSLLLATLGPKGVQELLNQKVNGTTGSAPAPSDRGTSVASVPVAQAASMQPQQGPVSSSSQLSAKDQLAILLVKHKIQESRKVYEANMKQLGLTALDSNESSQKMQELEAQAAFLMQQPQQQKAQAPANSNNGGANGPVDMAQLQLLLQQQQHQAQMLAQQHQHQSDSSVDLLKAFLSKSNDTSSNSVAPSAASLTKYVSGGSTMASENTGSGLDIKQLALLAKLQQQQQQQQQQAVMQPQQQQPHLDAQRLAALLSQQRQQSMQTSAPLVMGSSINNNGNTIQDQLKRLTDLIQGGGQQQQQPPLNLGMLGLPNGGSLPPATIVTNNRMKPDPHKPEKKRRRGRTGTFPQKMHQMLDDMEKVRNVHLVCVLSLLLAI